MYSKRFKRTTLAKINAIITLKSTLPKIPAKDTLKQWQCTETKHCDLSWKFNWKYKYSIQKCTHSIKNPILVVIRHWWNYLIFANSFRVFFPCHNNTCHVSQFTLDPAHNTCTDPGTPHFGIQNSSRGYEVILSFIY